MQYVNTAAFAVRSLLASFGLAPSPSVDLSTLKSLITGPATSPDAFLARLREKEPVCWLPVVDAWMVSRHADIRHLFLHPHLTSDPRVYRGYAPPADPSAARWITEMPFRSAPSDPRSMGRRLVSGAMTPRAAEAARTRVREVVREAADRLENRNGVVDLMAEFTSPIAATVIGRVAGVPAKGDDEVRFQRLARNATRAIRPFLSARKREETEKACAEICEHVSSLVLERALEPRNDLISALWKSSDHTAPGCAENIARVVAALVSAGTGTTGTACARALRTLFRHRDEFERIRADRSLVPKAVEELLRFDSGILVMPRYVSEAFSFRDRDFARGQLVALCIQSGNRDPRAFASPDRLDLDRDTSATLSFGYGPHYCIGANLARMTLIEMLTAALDFLPPSAQLLEDEIRWSSRGMMSQIKTLPVRMS